ncbi:unnamed protein product [Discula destructiva]
MSDLNDSVVFSLAAFICALLSLERGADKFLDNSAVVGKRLGVSPTLVGLLTCGAEWEELIVILMALGQRQTPLALGNLMGSTVANIWGSFSLGLLCTGGEIRFDRSSKIYTAVSVGLTLAFLVLLYTVPPQLQWAAGAVLIVTFALYIASVSLLIYRGTLVAPEDDSDDSDSESASGSDSDPDSELDSESERAGPSRAVDADDNGVSRESDTMLRRNTASSKKCSGRKQLSVRKGEPGTLRKPLLQLLYGLALMLVSGYVIAGSASMMGEAGPV